MIDLSVPDYCHKEDHYTHEKPKKVHYNIWSKAKPPYMFKGFMCEMYIKEKTVKGNFWVGSYDTTFRQYTVAVESCLIYKSEMRQSLITGRISSDLPILTDTRRTTPPSPANVLVTTPIGQ